MICLSCMLLLNIFVGAKARLENEEWMRLQKKRDVDLGSTQTEWIATLEKSHSVNPWRVVFPEVVSLVLTSTCWPNAAMAGQLLKPTDTQVHGCRWVSRGFMLPVCLGLPSAQSVQAYMEFICVFSFWISWLFCVLIFILIVFVSGIETL